MYYGFTPEVVTQFHFDLYHSIISIIDITLQGHTLFNEKCFK
jgi:hypothetical protein